MQLLFGLICDLIVSAVLAILPPYGKRRDVEELGEDGEFSDTVEGES